MVTLTSPEIFGEHGVVFTCLLVKDMCGAEIV